MVGERFRVLENTPFHGGVGNDIRLAGGAQWYSSSTFVFGYLPQSIVAVNHLGGTDLQKADSDAIIAASKRVQQQRTQFQGLTALGELRETIHELKHPFAGARKLIDTYFKSLRASKTFKEAERRYRRTGRQGGGVNSFLTEAANSWLEVAFGLKPLISDVKAAAEALARYQNDSRRAVVVGNGESVVASGSFTKSPIVNNCGTFDGLKTVTTQSVRYKVAMDYSRSANFGSNDRLRALTGLTADQFIPTVWELIPWSFLVDYFSNIGEVISAGCSSQEDVGFVLRTERLETIRSGSSRVGYTGFFGLQDGDWEKPIQSGTFVTTRTNVSRSSSANLPLPSVYFSLPGKASQWENMVALWKSNERSLFSRFSRG